MGIAIKIGGLAVGSSGSRNWTPRNFPGLSLNFDSKSGSSINDSVSSESASILTKVFLQGAASSAYIGGAITNARERCLDGGSYTYHMKLKMIGAIPSSGTPILVLGGGTVVTRRGIYIYGYATPIKTRVMVNDGAIQATQYIDSNVNTLLAASGIVDLLIQVNGTTKVITGGYYNSAGENIGTALNIDISSMTLNDNQNYSSIRFLSKEIAFDNFKKFSGIKTLEQCNTDSYVTDLQIHLPNVLSGVDLATPRVDFVRSTVTVADFAYADIGDRTYKYGFNHYYYYSAADYFFDVPNKFNGDVIAMDRTGGAFTIGFRVVAEKTAKGICDLVDGKIRFTNAFFDRSDVIIWGDAARLGYYDANNVKDFHISELNQRTLMSWLNVSYKGRLYVKFNTNSIEKWDRDHIVEILMTTTDIKGSDQVKALTYTGDIIAAVKSGGSYVYDANGYVQLGTLKTTTPMITMRFDDTRDTHLSTWLPLLQGYGINKAITGCHASQVGTAVGGVNFLSWADTLTLYNNGWEIGCHNREDNDYTGSGDITLVDLIESNLELGVSLQEAQSMSCDHYIGNKYSMQNPSVPYYAHKLGFKSAMAWGGAGIYGAVPQGINPLALDKYQLYAINTDIAVADPATDDPYYLGNDPNTTQIQNMKDAIDLAKSEKRWIIFMIHGTTEIAAMQTIIEYAQAQGVPFVNATEGVENTSYQV